MKIEVFSQSGQVRFKVFKNNKFLLNFYSNNVNSAKRELMKKLYYEHGISVDEFLKSKWIERKGGKLK